MILILASLILHHQLSTPSNVDHTDFVEGHFCGEIANTFWFRNCQMLLIADIVDRLKTADPGSREW